jgi:hypothetical protein
VEQKRKRIVGKKPSSSKVKAAKSSLHGERKKEVFVLEFFALSSHFLVAKGSGVFSTNVNFLDFFTFQEKNQGKLEFLFEVSVISFNLKVILRKFFMFSIFLTVFV